MRQLILRYLGIDASGRRQASVNADQLALFREEAQSLTTAVEFLAGRLNDTVTRDEVSQEIDCRLTRLESASAGAVSGAKHQMRRTRNAAWVLWGFLLMFTSFATIQLHDWHITECTLNLEITRSEDFVCTALFPFTDHSSATQVRAAMRMAEGDGSPRQEYHHQVSPRVVGFAFYTLLFSGSAYGLTRYRQRVREEEDLEVGAFTQEDLDLLGRAGGGVVTPRRTFRRFEP